MDKIKRYNRKLRQVIKRLDKIEISVQEGERLSKYETSYFVGKEISPNKIYIAKEILSKFGINEPNQKEE